MLNKKLVFAFLSVCFIVALFSFSYLKELPYEDQYTGHSLQSAQLMSCVRDFGSNLIYRKEKGVELLSVYSSRARDADYRNLHIPREYLFYVASRLCPGEATIEALRNTDHAVNFGSQAKPYWVYKSSHIILKDNGYNEHFQLYMTYPDLAPLPAKTYYADVGSTPTDVAEGDFMIVEINPFSERIDNSCAVSNTKPPSKTGPYLLKNTRGAFTEFVQILDGNVVRRFCCAWKNCDHTFHSADKFFSFRIKFDEALVPEIETIEGDVRRLIESFIVKQQP